MPQYESAPGALSRPAERALRCRPVQYEHLAVIVPTIDAHRGGLIEAFQQTVVVRAQTTPLLAGAYTGTLRLVPAPGWALRVVALSAYVRNPAGAAGTVFGPGALRTLTDAQLRLIANAPFKPVPGPDIGEPAVVVTLSGGNTLDHVERVPPIDSDNGFMRLAYGAAATGPFYWPADEATDPYPDFPDGIVLARSPEEGTLVGVNPTGIEFAWARVAIVGDVDAATVTCVYHAAPFGGYPPT